MENINNNEELIIKDENNQIIECNYDRVDFSDPSTILSYCTELTDEMSRMLDSVAELSSCDIAVDLTTEDFESLVSFEDELADAKKASQKQDGLIVSGFKKFATALGSKKYIDEDKKKSYSGRYEMYKERVNGVVDGVSRMKENAFNEFELRQTFIQELTPFIKDLEAMIKIGLIDKAMFDEEIKALEDQIPMDTTGDIIREVHFKKQLSAVFNSKLSELEAACVAYKEQIQAYRLQQNVGMDTIMKADSFIKVNAPLLKAQGSEMVFNVKQTDDLNLLKAATEATNQAILNNSKAVLENVKAATELTKEGVVSTATLQALHEAHSKGIEIIKQGKIEHEKKIEADRKLLESINSSLEQSQSEIMTILGDNKALRDIYEEVTTPRELPTATTNKSMKKGFKK